MCSPDVARQMGFPLRTSLHGAPKWVEACSMKLSHLIIWITQTKPKLIKKKLWESSDCETEEKPNYFPSFIVVESAEEIPQSKLSPFNIEKILSKSLKPKAVKKLKNAILAT